MIPALKCRNLQRVSEDIIRNHCRVKHLRLADNMINRFLIVSLCFWGLLSLSGGAETADSPTFTEDIALIVYEHCAPCHRSGMAAPFSLLTYDEVAKRAQQIVDVIVDGYMPPWLPEPGYGEFHGARRLLPETIKRVQRWVEQGTPKGPRSALPTMPDWPRGWQGGEPDLVVSLESEFELAAEGNDIYRNFVLSVPTKVRRYVKALEFRPENARIVHHALIYVDKTRESRRRDQASVEAGFDGMRVPSSAAMPEGQFLSWQPGALYSPETRGIPWALDPGADLVIQVHMNPSGKIEPFRCSVGLYFTEQAPEATPFKIKLTSLDIDIAPESKDFHVVDEWELPGDVDVTRVLPHAHYLCRRMEGEAVLPDGNRIPLLLIKDWDFNWQGDYIYDPPIFLPKGTVIKMRFIYDNSSANEMNPFGPPQRVLYGPQSTDEMAELWFQLILRNPSDRPQFVRTSVQKARAALLAFGRAGFANETQDPNLMMMTAQAKLAEGNAKAAFELFRKVVQVEPNRFNAWFNIGMILMKVGQIDTALQSFRKVISIDPQDAEAYGAVGVLLARQKKNEQAIPYLREALRLRPNDPVARRTLEGIQAAMKAAPGGTTVE